MPTPEVETRTHALSRLILHGLGLGLAACLLATALGYLLVAPHLIGVVQALEIAGGGLGLLTLMLWWGSLGRARRDRLTLDPHAVPAQDGVPWPLLLRLLIAAGCCFALRAWLVM